MSRFAGLLGQLNDRLDLPQPARARVLLEIAADLRDLERHFLDRGVGPDEARARAVEQCDLSDEAIGELIRVHAGPYRRFLARLGAQARGRWERLLLLFTLGVVVALPGRLVLGAPLFATAGPLAWPILFFTTLAVARMLPAIYRTWVARDHDARRLGAALPHIPLFAAANLFLGVWGAWLSFYPVARRAAREGADIVAELVEGTLTGAALMVTCLLSVFLIASLWFSLTRAVARIEQAEIAVLLAGAEPRA